MRDSTVIPQQDHKSLVQVIDAACVNATGAATAIQNWMFEQRGPYMPFFSGSPAQGYVGFYPAFSVLFILTSRLTEMKQHEVLVKRIDTWMEPTAMGKNRNDDINRMRDGIGLFTEYYYALNHSGVVTLRK